MSVHIVLMRGKPVCLALLLPQSLKSHCCEKGSGTPLCFCESCEQNIYFTPIYFVIIITFHS